MARGVSIHIGLNWLKDANYRKLNGDSLYEPLLGCVNDAELMSKIALGCGFKEHDVELLVTKQGADFDKLTADYILGRIGYYAVNLKPNDFFLITFAGHGSQAYLNKNQTWCLFDRMVFDFELNQLWAKFDEGVRILCISDSCHSGSVALEEEFFEEIHLSISETKSDDFSTYHEEINLEISNVNRNLLETVDDDLIRNSNLYSEVIKPTHNQLLQIKKDVKAVIISISACDDNEDAKEEKDDNGVFNGLFTRNLTRVWYGAGNYANFFKRLSDCVSRSSGGSENPQMFPDLSVIDASMQEFPSVDKDLWKKFLNQNPFQIEPDQI
jgi:Caspase domain